MVAIPNVCQNPFDVVNASGCDRCLGSGHYESYGRAEIGFHGHETRRDTLCRGSGNDVVWEKVSGYNPAGAWVSTSVNVSAIANAMRNRHGVDRRASGVGPCVQPFRLSWPPSPPCALPSAAFAPLSRQP